MSSERNPHLEYSRRLDARRKAVQRLDRKDLRIAQLRLLTAIAFGILLWLAFWREAVSPWWLAAPAGAFLVLMIVHARVAEKKRRAEKAVKFYEDGLARIEDRWTGRGQSTELLRDESHLYAPDLDIFGPGSLFELLCTARTRAGEATLAKWLSEPAPKEQILARQEAVDDLRDRIDLREDLAIIGSDIRPSMHAEEMTRWGMAPILFRSAAPRIIAPILATLVTAILIIAVFSSGNSPWFAVFYVGLIVEGVFWFMYGRGVRDVLEGVEKPQEDLKLLSHILARVEPEQFRSKKLIEMQSRFNVDAQKSSAQITRLVRAVDMLSLNGLDVPAGFILLFVARAIVPFSLLILLKLQVAFAVEAWRAKWGKAIGPWISTAAEFEALCALAAYAYEHPADPFPEIVDDERVFEGEQLRHPLMASSQCVPNSVRFADALQLLVVSGSNMSGKSTLLRTVGVNAVLAMAGAPVRAQRLRLCPFAIGATIRIHDSLQAGTSRFYAEIQRIRQAMDLTNGDIPVLFLLDEILHGTNSHDRAIGAEAIVKALIQRGAIGLVTTHDLALTKVADSLAPRAANVHFEDELKDGQLKFDYRMKPGVVRKSNALELMRAVGIQV